MSPHLAMQGFLSLGGLPEERVAPLVTRRVVTGEKGMIVAWTLGAGARVAARRHPHDQIVWVPSGRMEMRVGDERRTCGPGDMAVIPSGVEHKGRAIEDSEVVDVFVPPREDFLQGGTPASMRRG